MERGGCEYHGDDDCFDVVLKIWLIAASQNRVGNFKIDDGHRFQSLTQQEIKGKKGLLFQDLLVQNFNAT